MNASELLENLEEMITDSRCAGPEQMIVLNLPS